MAFVIKVALLTITFVTVYNNSCRSASNVRLPAKDFHGKSFDKILEESSNLFYKLAQSIMKKTEFENCTVVLIHDENIKEREHLPSETELLIQQNSRLRPIIYITWDKMSIPFLYRLRRRSYASKFSEKCYVVFGEFIQKVSTDLKLRESIYKTFLPNAKFIFRWIPARNEKWPTRPMILSPFHAEFSYDILEVVVAYNKLHQMRILLYSYCPICYPPGFIWITTKRGHPILSAGMGSDGVIKEYRPSLFPDYTKNFHKTLFHLVYHPSTLTSVADMETSISTEADFAFHYVNLVAKSLNMSVDKRNIKYHYDIGSRSRDGKWSGYIGELKSHPNSIGLSFTLHRKYSNIIQVSSPYGAFSLGIVYMDAKASKNASVWVAISHLITVNSFIIFCIAIFFIGAFLCAIEVFQRRSFPMVTNKNRKQSGWDQYTWMHRWMEYSWLPVKICFQQSFKLSHVRLRTSLVFIGLWWFSSIYYSTYIKTFLTSTLTQAEKSSLVTSLADLIKDKDWRMGTFLKPSVWNDLVGNSSYKELTGRMEYFDSQSSCLEKVSEKEFACIGTSGILKAYVSATKHDNSHLVYVDGELLPSYLTLAFAKHSPFADIISKKLQSFVEADIRYDFIQPIKTKPAPKEIYTGPTRRGSEIQESNKRKNPLEHLPSKIKGEDVDLTFKEQLFDSFEELFEEAEIEDIFSFVFLGFMVALFAFVIEQTFFSIHNFRNLKRARAIVLHNRIVSR